MVIKTKTKIHLFSAIIVTIFAALSVSSYAKIYQYSNQPTIQLSLSSPTTNLVAQQKK